MRKIFLLLFVLLLLPVLSLAATRVEEDVTLYRVYLGHGVGEAALQEADIQKFIDEVITPQFPQGLTIIEARGQWNSEGGLQKESTSMVHVQGPSTPETLAKIERIAELYVERFKKSRSAFFYESIPGATAKIFY